MQSPGHKHFDFYLRTMYKIYFNNTPLFLTNNRSDVDEYLRREDTMFIDDMDKHTVKTMLYEMEQPNIHAGVFLHEDAEALLNAIKKKFTVIRAAGGLVFRKKDEILMIFRRGKWDLPKGKLDEGEDLSTCALREVKEETGLKKLNIIQPLIVTYHTYNENKQHTLKESHWFLMQTRDDGELVPQIEEDIEKCEWVKIDNISVHMENTYALIHDVMHAGLNALKITE